MTRTMRARIFFRWTQPFWLWLLAALGGALLAMLALVLFYRMGGLAMVAPPVVLPGAKLQLVSGQGGQTPVGLEIRQVGPQGWAAARGGARMAPAALYRQFAWRIDGLQPGSEVRLVWATAADPKTSRERVLPPASSDEGVLDLGMEPGWQGRIAGIGLAVRGPLSQPLVVRHLELRPVVPTVGALLRGMVEDWTTFEDWSQRSINYHSGAPLNALFPPVVMVALWVGFGMALYALLYLPRRAPGALLPYAALFLLGWLALDVRWQWDLGQRLVQTAKDFAGKSEEDRRLAALDGEFYRFLREVRQRLPERPARLFIVSADPAGFWAGRARYHLLPHNGYAGLARLPLTDRARPGDYILILSPLADARYDPERRMLEEGDTRLPVEMLHFAARGALFRIREGA
ncbi:MAG: hypothetical protein P9F19_14615 [Candidatus Contendobacter sp.]|nr:hypothetical protein [Candidatus Contendobacter sp.]MDG4558605.1 hypothetical protein [Candidatus Contendobacter sp.]